MTKDVISLSISVLLLFRHYIFHKITFGAPSSGGVLCSACGAFISFCNSFSYDSFLISIRFSVKVIRKNDKTTFICCPDTFQKLNNRC